VPHHTSAWTRGRVALMYDPRTHASRCWAAFLAGQITPRATLVVLRPYINSTALRAAAGATATVWARTTAVRLPVVGAVRRRSSAGSPRRLTLLPRRHASGIYGMTRLELASPTHQRLRRPTWVASLDAIEPGRARIERGGRELRPRAHHLFTPPLEWSTRTASSPTGARTQLRAHLTQCRSGAHHVACVETSSSSRDDHERCAVPECSGPARVGRCDVEDMADTDGTLIDSSRADRFRWRRRLALRAGVAAWRMSMCRMHEWIPPCLRLDVTMSEESASSKYATIAGPPALTRRARRVRASILVERSSYTRSCAERLGASS